MRILFLFIIAAFAVSSCTTPFNKVQKSKDYDYKLSKADEYFAKGKYRFAEELYVDLFPVFKGTDKFEDLYYKYAYCSYYQNNFEAASSLFNGFLEVFPTSKKAEEVAYMNAYSFYKQSPRVELEQVNTMKVIGMMQSFINTHPGSTRIAEATDIIDKSRAKLEEKDRLSAELYYKISQFRAAALAYTNLLNSYPESTKGDSYLLMSIKSDYQFAKLSVYEKQQERFEKVVSEYNDFADRFPESNLLTEASNYNTLSLNHIKEIQNEQTKTSADR
ncbi:hypothetical protein BH09BAC2_BH09BAC2_17610 [soil metagenome]